MTRATETKVLKHALPANAEGARLKAKLNLTEGEATVSLLDAAGTTRYQRTFRPGKTNLEQTFPGNPGEWQVRVEFKRATGRYTIALIAY